MQEDRFLVVDGDTAGRAAICHAFSAIGCALPFETLDDVAPLWPEEAWLVVRDENGAVESALARLDELDRYYPLVAYAENPATERVVETLLAGAVGYLEWPLPGEALALRIDLFRAAAAERNERIASSRYARRVLRDLSMRERAVVDALSEGQTNRQIAALLGISPRTVEIHRANALDKLEARNSIEAVRLVYQADDLPSQRRRNDLVTADGDHQPSDAEAARRAAGAD